MVVVHLLYHYPYAYYLIIIDVSISVCCVHVYIYHCAHAWCCVLYLIAPHMSLLVLYLYKLSLCVYYYAAFARVVTLYIAASYPHAQQ